MVLRGQKLEIIIRGKRRWGLEYHYHEYYHEKELTNFSAQGTVRNLMVGKLTFH